jgi:uncharacterized protein (TIGR03118 family)
MTLLPAFPGTAHPNLAVTADKSGTMRLIDIDNMGGFNAGGPDRVLQEFTANPQGLIYSSPVYFDGKVYIQGVGDVIKAFALKLDKATNTMMLDETPVSQGTSVSGFPGEVQSVSANGTTNGIVWSPEVDGFATGSPAILRAYDANDLSNVLYASNQAGPRDTAGGGIKFSTPTIANGMVYLGTQTEVDVYGLLPPSERGNKQNAFAQANLVSDIPGMAQITDPSLKNSWGVSESATSPFWVSNQGTSTSTLYSVTSAGVAKVPLTVAIPQTSAGPQGPTGQVANQTTSFVLNGNPSNFIFANLNGTISAWNGGTVATVEATTPGASYTGLAIATDAKSGSLLYAADGAQNRIDVFNGSFVRQTLSPRAFVDPALPKNQGLVPFNVQNIGGDIFVTYAPAGHAAQTAATEGQGAVAVFDTAGHFMRQLISGGKLASPWGITMAPSGFGQFGGDLLVGNFAYNFSEINAFDPKNGKFLGTLSNAAGQPIRNQALWYIGFGNGAAGGDKNTLYFAAGINGEADGLFGSIAPVTA